MRATYAVVKEQGILEIREEALDPSAIQGDQLLLEAETTVVSAGTELAIYTAIAPGVRTPGSWNAYPWRPGYGLVGRVLNVGIGLKDDFPVGTRIFCFGRHASHQFYSVSREAPKAAAFKLDEDLPAETAVMLRMALIALNGPRVADFQAGDTVAIFGLGLVGNLAAQLFQHAGARVIAFDPVERRCELARSTGIKTALCVPAGDQVTTLYDLAGQQGVDVAVDAVGDSTVIMRCIQVCKPFGEVILLGSPRRSHVTDVTEAFRQIHVRWLSMRGALEWCLPPHPVNGKIHSIETNLNHLADLVKNGSLQIGPLITHLVQPKELSEAYEGLLHQPGTYLGVVVDWRGEDPPSF